MDTLLAGLSLPQGVLLRSENGAYFLVVQVHENNDCRRLAHPPFISRWSSRMGTWWATRRVTSALAMPSGRAGRRGRVWGPSTSTCKQMGTSSSTTALVNQPGQPRRTVPRRVERATASSSKAIAIWCCIVDLRTRCAGRRIHTFRDSSQCSHVNSKSIYHDLFFLRCGFCHVLAAIHYREHTMRRPDREYFC
jgi:hypothetical protein